MERDKLDYDGPIEVSDGIFWVGYADDNAGLHCNPYLITEGNEAVLIDGGSRDDFSIVMMKILQTGVDPNQIQRLIYQHYDPDLCGSIPHFESLIKNDELKILSHRENNIFIKYYSSKRPKECIETLGMTYTFATGRKLEFIRTPYAHSPGSFMTYDTKTGTLFSSDIFGSYDKIWELFINMKKACKTCDPAPICHHDDKPCVINGIIDFHRRIMTSGKALKYALAEIKKIDPVIIAPQHGSVVDSRRWIDSVYSHLVKEELIGIDWYLEEMAHE